MSARPFKSATCFKKDGEPLSTYYTEYDAEEGAAYVLSQHRHDLSPYECSECGYWHLSPKKRQTPSKECIHCTDSNGKHKELYETEDAASRRAEIIFEEQKIKLKVYPCPHQKGWHLTKNTSGIF